MRTSSEHQEDLIKQQVATRPHQREAEGNMADQFRSVREIMRGMGVGYLSLHAWVDGRFFRRPRTLC